MKKPAVVLNERGVALVVVLLVALTGSAIALGAALMSANTEALNLYDERLGALESAAEAGMEIARSRINGNKALYPESLFVTLEHRAAVTDAAGKAIPHLRRTTYVGPTGVTSGQYGVFGSIVAVVEDDVGNAIVRRTEVFQESFAKFAYFTDSEGGNIWFGGGDQLFGPVHSNDQIKIHTTRATFHGTVRTAKNVHQPQYGTFKRGYEQYVPSIAMPTTADLNKLKNQAQSGLTAIAGTTAGGVGEATTRIEFVAIDLNLDGDVTDADEGFMRVYQALNNPNWVSGDVPADYGTNYLRNADNCGDFHASHAGQFQSLRLHATSGSHPWHAAAVDNTRRCYLGGDPAITNGFTPTHTAQGGGWLPWPGTVAPLVTARRLLDAAYLWPITRAYNPSFKGVVHVTGKVVVSGVIRGQVTLAATSDIIIGDDLTYATNPGAATCNDILGLFSGADVMIADNTVNAPIVPRASQAFRSYDDTQSEFIHGVVLALSNFTVEDYNLGSNNAEPCEGSPVGRGCLYLTGGIIQQMRGPVGLTSGYGYTKRYAYDQCAATEPPPYFPTTGHFARGRFFEVDPVQFDAAEYFRLLTPRQ